MDNLCNNCGAPVSTNIKTCEYCGSLVDASSMGEIDIEICTIADTAFNADNFKEAIIYYDKILEQNKSNSNAWLRKGRCLLLIGKKGIYSFDSTDTNSLSEGLLCLNNAIRFSSSKKVRTKVLKVLSTFIESNNAAMDFNTIEIVANRIGSFKKFKEEEIIPLLNKAIIAFEQNIISDKKRELEFYLDYNKNLVNQALEIKRNKVINEYNNVVDLILEYEKKSGLLPIKETYKNYFSTKKNNAFVLKKINA